MFGQIKTKSNAERTAASRLEQKIANPELEIKPRIRDRRLYGVEFADCELHMKERELLIFGQRLKSVIGVSSPVVSASLRRSVTKTRLDRHAGTDKD